MRIILIWHKVILCASNLLLIHPWWEWDAIWGAWELGVDKDWRYSFSILYGVSESVKETGQYKSLRITDFQIIRSTGKMYHLPITIIIMHIPIFWMKAILFFARTGATVGKSFMIEELMNFTIYASCLIRVHTVNDKTEGKCVLHVSFCKNFKKIYLFCILLIEIIVCLTKKW